MTGYLPFVTSSLIVERSDAKKKDGVTYIGAIINNLYFQHAPTTSSPFANPSWNLDERIVYVSSPPDKVIAATLSGPRDVLIDAMGVYKYYVYELVLMQIVEELRKSRDVEVHGKVMDAFKGISSRAEIPKALKAINTIIPRGSDDFNKIISTIEGHPRGSSLAAIIADIDSLFLSADNEMMMKAITPDGIVGAISRSCVRGRVNLKSFPNVYEPCSSSNGEYCGKDGRLIVDVTDDYWERLPGLAFEDLSNPIKRPYLIDRLYYDNIIDEFSYNVAADESLFIRKK
jgi:hypothetical protein